MSDPNAPTPDQPQQPPAGQPQQPYSQPQQPQQPYAQPQQPQQPYAQPQQPYAGGAAPYSPETDKQLAMWANIGGIVGFLPSLIIWLVGKDRGPRTNVEGKEALNWQITFTILYVALVIVVSIINAVLIVSGAYMLVGLIGWLPFLWWVVNVIFSIMGGVKVNGGGSYRYPINFRFIK